MRTVEMELPKLGLVAATRAMLGAGLGLLIAPRLTRQQRRAVGWTLLVIGLVSTVPLLALVFGRRSATGGAEPLKRRLAEAVH